MSVGMEALTARRPHSSCRKLHDALSKVPAPDPRQTGSKPLNMLVAWMRCEVKSGRKNKCDSPGCGDVWREPEGFLKAFETCSKSVMGAGAFEGRPDCAAELERLIMSVDVRKRVERFERDAVLGPGRGRC